MNLDNYIEFVVNRFTESPIEITATEEYKISLIDKKDLKYVLDGVIKCISKSKKVKNAVGYISVNDLFGYLKPLMSNSDNDFKTFMIFIEFYRDLIKIFSEMEDGFNAIPHFYFIVGDDIDSMNNNFLSYDNYKTFRLNIFQDFKFSSFTTEEIQTAEKFILENYKYLQTKILYSRYLRNTSKRYKERFFQELCMFFPFSEKTILENPEKFFPCILVENKNINMTPKILECIFGIMSKHFLDDILYVSTGETSFKLEFDSSPEAAMTRSLLYFTENHDTNV